MFSKITTNILYSVIALFVVVTLSSFLFANEVTTITSQEGVTDFFTRNWALIALVISEIAALLPGKPKGIIQAVVHVVDKIIQNKKVPPKSY